MFGEKCAWENLLKNITGCRVPFFFFFFWTKHSPKYDLLAIYEIFNVLNSAKSEVLNMITVKNKRLFWCFLLRYQNLSFLFFQWYEVVVGNNVRQQTCCLYVLLIVHCFLARVQSPTCNTYGKSLRESIMAVLIRYCLSIIFIKVNISKLK